jgi:hypothetical protein
MPSPQRKPEEPMPVFIEKRGYGLLHPMEKAPDGKGVVQFGTDGPFELHSLDEMEPIEWAEFDKWLNR